VVPHTYREGGIVDIKLAHFSRMSIVFLWGIGLSLPVAARNIHVCAACAHTSIQSAVNDAVSGDVIYVAAGRYLENVTIEGKQLTLIGAGASTTGVPGVIQPATGVSEVVAAGRGPVFTLGTSVFAGVYHLTTIQGFMITNGNHLGGTGVGGGIQVRAGASLHLLDSIVMHNTARAGGGIGVDSPIAAAFETTISGCLIDENVAIPATSSHAPGGGIAVMVGSSASIRNSIVTRNQSTSGGGVSGETGSTLTIIDTTVSGNRSASVSTPYGPTQGAGGGLQSSGDVAISGSFFVGNTAQGEDGGGGIELFFTDWRAHTISNTIIARNKVPETGLGGGIAAYGDDSRMNLALNKVYVVENLDGGGLWSTVRLVLTDTTVKDNVGGDICRDGIC
jgi:hypothetical protein